MASTVVYATAAELKAQPDIHSDADDTVIDLLLAAASRCVDGICNRRRDGFKAATLATARSYVGRGVAYVYTDEFADIEMFEIKSNRFSEWIPQNVDNYAGFIGNPDFPTLDEPPYHGVTLLATGVSSTAVIADGQPGIELPPTLTARVTARWGYADTVPDLVKTSTITLATRWFKRGQSAWADSMAAGDFGQLMFVKKLDPDVEAMLILSRLARPTYG